MEDDISVESISRLSRTSVQPARDSICATFSDGNHFVVIPVMGYNKIVQAIREVRLARGANILARIIFRSDGSPVPEDRSREPVLLQLGGYIRLVAYQVKAGKVEGWIENADLEHARKVMHTLIDVYPIPDAGAK